MFNHSPRKGPAQLLERVLQLSGCQDLCLTLPDPAPQHLGHQHRILLCCSSPTALDPRKPSRGPVLVPLKWKHAEQTANILIFSADEALIGSVWSWRLAALIHSFRLTAQKPASELLPCWGMRKCCCHRGAQSPAAAQAPLPCWLLQREVMINPLFLSQLNTCLFLLLQSSKRITQVSGNSAERKSQRRKGLAKNTTLSDNEQ